MSLWVKICANTSLADAQLAASVGADAVGFVFAPSPRRVTPEQVAEITLHLPADIEKIGVFVDADLETMAAAVELCGLTGVQLHSEITGGLAAELKRRFQTPTRDLRILRVIHFGEQAVRQLQQASGEASVDAALIDSRTPAAVGGTGVAFDWQAARATIFSDKARLKLVAAGGLNPDNVTEAVAILNPWGVDVASGVEAFPGRKDPAKVRDFVARARASQPNARLSR
jgi:phosphoribosylanthranilate isomerase